MSNLLKRSYVSGDDDNKRVIDSNALVAERLKLLEKALKTSLREDSREFDEDGFSAGLNAENVEMLLADSDGQEGQEVLPEEAQNVPDLDEINAEAEQIISDAEAQAQAIIEAANAEAEANKQAVYEEARNAGHDEGYEAGMAEVDGIKAELAEKEAQLEQAYQERVDKLEPMFVDTFTDIYEHIFHVSLSENKEVIFYLIKNALHTIDSSTGFMIHVSKDDYGFVSMQKKELLAGISSAEEAEIVEDMTLKANEAFIETGAGIFDCSLETELSGLRRMLRLLSFEKNGDDK
ncbi:MAG: hypothetical protein J6P45_00265 [Lachnospiraceae bacterium]|nr:hypothetical protein [Lachnospiraceae bacterium]MBR1876692.1 hypothetical protein [Lachnospiraceae bacterium]